LKALLAGFSGLVGEKRPATSSGMEQKMEKENRETDKEGKRYY